MKAFCAFVSTALVCGATAALAQEVVTSRVEPGGTNKAFEVSLGLGYSQGFGNVGVGQPKIADIGAAGAAAELGLGYRINPNALIGVYGAAALYTQGDQVTTGDVTGFAAGIQGNWHFGPGATIDPWIGLGAGWRMLALNQDAGSTTLHGIDLVRLQVGLDYQVTPMFAIAPVIGGSLNMMLTEKGPQDAAFRNITDPTANLYVFGGVVGRFDFFGSREGGGVRVASR